MRIAFVAVVLAAGCAHAPPPPAATTTLYDRLGGQPAIAAVVDAFVARVAGDKRINKYFWNADVPNLKQMLTEQICQAAGGPCVYTGKDMKSAHAGMNLKDGDFGAIVEDLVASLTKLKVPAREQHELLALLAPMKPDIVGQ